MSQVYFLLAPSVNLMKIGRSSRAEARFQELRLLSPVPLEVFGVIAGGSDQESDLHRKFDHLHSHGEWFHATKELRCFAWSAAMQDLWNRAPREWREEFLGRVDRPVFGS